MRDPGPLPYPIHTNRELGLMLRGIKPLAAFTLDGEIPVLQRYFRLFDRHVLLGKLVKREIHRTDPVPLRYVFYALPGQEWRIDKLIELRDTPEWNLDLERREGELLGYEDWQNDIWIERIEAWRRAEGRGQSL